jgi:serine/threonine-protein kinase SRPK3
LKRIVLLLGRPPQSWWTSWEKRRDYFDEDGRPREVPKLWYSSLREKLRMIHTDDDLSFRGKGPLYEEAGTALAEEEVDLLADLLEKMLRYRPDERIVMDEVVAHPWFAYQ